MYGHVGHRILHEDEKNSRRKTALAYDPKEEKFLLYCPLYMKQLEEYTTALWPWGLITESVTEDKVWGFLFYQTHWDKRIQGGRLKASEKRIYARNFDKKECTVLLWIILVGTTALVENCNTY